MMDNPPHILRLSSPPSASNPNNPSSSSSSTTTTTTTTNPLHHHLSNNLNASTHPNLFIDTSIGSTETSLPTPPLQTIQDHSQSTDIHHKRRHSFTYEPHLQHHSHVPSSSNTTSDPFNMNNSIPNTSPTPNTLSNVSSVSSSPPLIHSFSDESFNDLPLSMKFMHKPSRSQELLEKASDPTRRNSLLNSHIDDITLNNNNNNNNNQTNNIDQNSDIISSSPVSQTIEYSSPMENVSMSNGTEPGYTLVRKKSGEILKPSLKSDDSSYFDLKKRSRSLPTTPTYKQVHFGGGNDVRYFKKKDKPNAISATNSPTLDEGQDEANLLDIRKLNLSSSERYYGDDDEYEYDEEDDDYDDQRRRRYEYEEYEDNDDDDYEDSDDEFVANNAHGETKYPRYAEVFDDDDDEDDEGDKDKEEHRYKYQSPPKTIDWQLKLLNFTPLSSYDVKIKAESPVFLERLFITVDKKYLLGHIAVKNLAFEKYLIVRYSLDNWCTIIEIPTIYVPDRPEILKANNYDRFIFQIPLENLFHSFRINASANSSTDSINNDNNPKTGDIKQEKAYQLCIKYYSDRNEYWDNNGFKNYHIKLIKSTKIHPHEKQQQQQHYKNHHAKVGSPPPPPDFNQSHKDPKIQAHNKKPKYSNSYLKRIVSDSQIELNKSDKKNSSPTPESIKPIESAPIVSKSKDNNMFHTDDNSSSDVNDFEKNNFYMSSPMLSTYNNNKSKPSTAASGINANGSNSITSNNNHENNSKDVNESIESLPKNTNIHTITNPSTITSTDDSKPSSTSTKLQLTSPPFAIRDENDSNISPDNEDEEIVSPSLGQTQLPPQQYLVPPPLDPQSYKELLDNYCFFNSSNPNGEISSTDTFHSPYFGGGGHYSRRANHQQNSNSRNTSSASSNTLDSDDGTIKGNITPPSTTNQGPTTDGGKTFTVSSFLGA
ncbi:putative phosphatase regulatory subunit-domain-containing protein [Scheffersomyces coipomensis]|uniref:putative phosphatase regulatory subunit-domain-containing protein n=1 Tax=Scheffersomyces coipomensis TaxID=1788519 RepID=UPI00315D2AAF